MHVDESLNADGWSAMSESEARNWCNRWGIGLDFHGFKKWTPRIEGVEGQELEKVTAAVEGAWSYLLTIRQPCISRDGHPSFWVMSKALIQPNINSNSGRYEEDRAPAYEWHASFHNPQLPPLIKIEDCTKYTGVRAVDRTKEIVLDVQDIGTQSLSGIILSKLSFTMWEGASICQDFWLAPARKEDRRQRCPKCGDFGTGFGVIRNERRFFHERNRSCYVGVVENRLKRNPLVKCPKCGGMGREHHGRDGHVRIRHSDRVCYVG